MEQQRAFSVMRCVGAACDKGVMTFRFLPYMDTRTVFDEKSLLFEFSFPRKLGGGCRDLGLKS